jgi:hypothetical protein
VTLDELLAAGPTCSVPEAGLVAFGVGASRSYELAAAGVIPTLRLGDRRVVVPVARLAALLGADDHNAAHTCETEFQHPSEERTGHR